ncbi:hypothetical protein Nekkels1_51 [Cellulophaga phage Nekkels_1]|uniref:Uncharacterized protein n=1 Tax=Cellulophaga phage Nekkels_1 TaxID=2745692 RepID=A0A8E4XVJ7_9CAUD|nr:hypothetical protein M1M31_gp51 [Cellulophaga phage Nekkels_1]QQO97054.1 hypothetical protein Nekkels1_51 [Cellulophaga phage Nekkels_1]QQO97147.1 hypothetical protein Nekkels2_51 [Cellulophaga phage Nekkels_2]
MASLPQLSAQVDILTQNLSDLNDTVNAILSNTIIIPNYTIDVNDSNVKVGDTVIGSKSGINGGYNFIGKVLIAPPTQDSHIDFILQI